MNEVRPRAANELAQKVFIEKAQAWEASKDPLMMLQGLPNGWVDGPRVRLVLCGMCRQGEYWDHLKSECVAAVEMTYKYVYDEIELPAYAEAINFLVSAPSTQKGGVPLRPVRLACGANNPYKSSRVNDIVTVVQDLIRPVKRGLVNAAWTRAQELADVLRCVMGNFWLRDYQTQYNSKLDCKRCLSTGRISRYRKYVRGLIQDFEEFFNPSSGKYPQECPDCRGKGHIDIPPRWREDIIVQGLARQAHKDADFELLTPCVTPWKRRAAPRIHTFSSTCVSPPATTPEAVGPWST
jgi:hypothetical protein